MIKDIHARNSGGLKKEFFVSQETEMAPVKEHILEILHLRHVWLSDDSDKPEFKLFPQYEEVLPWDCLIPKEKDMEEYHLLEHKKDDTYGATRKLNLFEYRRKFPTESAMWFRLPVKDGIGIVASETTGEVMVTPFSLIKELMHPEKWKNLFPSIIVNASMVSGEELVSLDEDTESASLEIQAEIQVLSPLVGRREMVYQRTCYRLEAGGWLVVDLPSPSRTISGYCQLPFIRSCLVRPSSKSKGLSSVIWIDFSQYQPHEIHPLYYAFVNSGQGFGSPCWFRMLSRECRRRASHAQYFSPLVSLSHEGKAPKRLVMLAKEMTRVFYSGIASATPCGSSVANDAEECVFFAMGSMYWVATKSTRFQVRLNKLFELVKVIDCSLGAKVFQIPSDEENDCISLHLHSRLKDKRVLRETYLDNFEGVVVMTVLDSETLNNKDDVSSVISSAFALSIHSLLPDSSSLTVTYMQQSSASQIEDDWKKEVSLKISNMIKDINAHSRLSDF